MPEGALGRIKVKKRVGLSILMMLSCMVTLQQPCYAKNEETQSVTTSQEGATPSAEATLLPQEETKPSQHDKYATLKKFLNIVVGVGVAGAVLYVGKNISDTKTKEDVIGKLLISKEWQAAQPLSSIYIHQVLYKQNKPMQDEFEKIQKIFTKGYIPDYYFPFGCTYHKDVISKQLLLPLSREDISAVQSFIKKLFQDNAQFLTAREAKEAQWKRFLEYSRELKISPLYERFLHQAGEILNIDHRQIGHYGTRNHKSKFIEDAYNRLKNQAAEADEARKLLRDFYIDKTGSEKINPDNFPLIAQKVDMPDKVSNYENS
jgi:hypothetical protein